MSFTTALTHANYKFVKTQSHGIKGVNDFACYWVYPSDMEKHEQMGFGQIRDNITKTQYCSVY